MHLRRVITLKEMKILVRENLEGKIMRMEPINKVTGRPGESKVLICRIYTQDEIDRETSQCMQLGVHTYHRENGRVRQDR
ncbi:MAG: hypothetical protein K0R80_1594 [Clostridia bacterium]|jgi:hypothetical protein|nr:hypothetical protein [Clostridia bacterium]